MQGITIITVFLFTLLIGNSTMTYAASHTYVDVPETHNNYTEVTYLLERGIIPARTTYGINDIMTREKVAVLIIVIFISTLLKRTGKLPTPTLFFHPLQLFKRPLFPYKVHTEQSENLW